MTDTEILATIKAINYACLFVMVSGQRTKFGPGELAWIGSLRRASSEQREALDEKLTRWNERRTA